MPPVSSDLHCVVNGLAFVGLKNIERNRTKIDQGILVENLVPTFYLFFSFFFCADVNKIAEGWMTRSFARVPRASPYSPER